jgi:hypothetical protein
VEGALGGVPVDEVVLARDEFVLWHFLCALPFRGRGDGRCRCVLYLLQTRAGWDD